MAADRERRERRPHREVLPLSLPPRGLSREQAAAYLGISPSLFSEMVADRRLPPPKLFNKRQVWDRYALDLAFDGLPDKAAPEEEFAL